MNRSSSHLARLGGILIAIATAHACAAAPADTFTYLEVPDTGNVTVLPPPLTSAETAALHTSFDWASTSPLAVEDDQGRPALYYALVYLRNAEERELLESMMIYHDALPLFPEEMTPWSGSEAGVISFEGDGGVFAFAFVPGAVFNALRSAALEGNEIFDAVILRDAPEPSAILGGGMLDYEYLADHGCNLGFRLDELSATPDVTAATAGKSRPKLLFRALRAVVRLARGIANVVRRVTAWVKPKRDFDLRLRVLNSDSAFAGTGTPVPPDAVLRRAWGPYAGRPLVPWGAQIEVRANMGLVTEKLSLDGHVHMRVPYDGHLVVFMNLRNEAALITTSQTGGIWEDRFKFPHQETGAGRRDDVALSYDIQSPGFGGAGVHLLAELTDAFDFTSGVLGHRMTRAAVFMGPGNGPLKEAAVTTCGRFFGFGTAVLGGARGWSFLGTLITIFAEHDILIGKPDARTRLVPVHEYGHFVMCDMLHERGARDFARVWGTLLGQTTGADTSLRALQTRQIVEGWADFFASQVAGGTNYFNPSGSFAAGSDAFCNSAQVSSRAPCVEDNVGGPFGGGFPNQVTSDADLVGSTEPDVALGAAFIATVLTDFFDGVPATEALGNGVLWSRDTGLPQLNAGSDLGDESVRMDLRELRIILRAVTESVKYWNIKAFMNAAASVAMTTHTREEVCALLALHDPANDCSAVAPVLSTGKSKSPLIPSSFDLRVAVTHASPETPVLLEASWVDVGTTGTGFRVAAMDPDDATLAEATVAYARQATWAPSEGMPFDRTIQVGVARVDGERTSESVSASIHTPAQPVAVISASPWYSSAIVTWTPVVAFSYEIEISIGATTWVVPGSNPEGTVVPLNSPGTYSVRVWSRDALGRRSSFASPSTNVAPIIVIIE